MSRLAVTCALLAAACEPMWTTWEQREPVRVEVEPGAVAPAPPAGGRLR